MEKPASKTRKADGEVSLDSVESRLNKVMPEQGLKKPISDHNFENPEKSDKRSNRKPTLDPLTNSLNCSRYYHKMIWPAWFNREVNGLKYKLVVDRYYEEKKLAIDFKLKTKEQAHIPLKKKLLEDHGILYFHLTDMDSVNEMLAQLQEQ